VRKREAIGTSEDVTDPGADEPGGDDEDRVPARAALAELPPDPVAAWEQGSRGGGDRAKDEPDDRAGPRHELRHDSWGARRHSLPILRALRFRSPSFVLVDVVDGHSREREQSQKVGRIRADLAPSPA
jgi:hypothetical protein